MILLLEHPSIYKANYRVMIAATRLHCSHIGPLQRSTDSSFSEFLIS